MKEIPQAIKVGSGFLTFVLECEHCGHKESVKTDYRSYRDYHEQLLKTYDVCSGCRKR